jgi:hypothetical protein
MQPSHCNCLTVSKVNGCCTLHALRAGSTVGKLC